MTTSAATPSTGMPTPEGPAILRRDFPDWLPPMLVKELRQGLRTRGFVGALVLFQLVMMLVTLVSLATQVATPQARMAGSALTGFFWTILIVQLLLVTPTRAVGGLQAEVESRTLDLLVLTRLNAWRIVLGKWISLLAQAVLLMIAMLPYLIVRYFTDSADIAADVGRCLVMLGVSALLTGAGLWASGVARALRIMVVILLAATLPTVAGGFGPMLFGTRPWGAPGNPFANIFSFPLDILNGVLIGAFFLVSAVRNIAPPAENHCLFARSLPAIALLPAAIAAAYGAQMMAVRQLYIAGAGFALVSLFELVSTAVPLAPHWREYRRRGLLMRAVGCGSLPGWESALAYALAGAGLWIGFALMILPTGTVASRDLAERAAWLAVLAVAGLVYPVGVRSFIRVRSIPPGLMYALLLLLPVILSWTGIGLAESKWKITELRSLMELAPVSSFLFSLNPRSPSAKMEWVQAGVALFVVGVAWWRAQPYWARVRALDPGPAETVTLK